jgi:hypothetical protein
MKLQGENHNFNDMFDKISFQEEGSIVGSEDVIKQYDTLPSTADGKVYRFMEEIQLLYQEFNFHFQDIYACMYDLQSTYF